MLPGRSAQTAGCPGVDVVPGPPGTTVEVGGMTTGAVVGLGGSSFVGVVLEVAGPPCRHCEYQSFEYTHVDPEAQVFSPV